MAELAVKVSVAMEFDNVQKKKRKPARERKASYESLCERLKSAIAKDGGRYVTFGFASGESDPSMERCGLLACGVEYDKKLYFLYVQYGIGVYLPAVAAGTLIAASLVYLVKNVVLERRSGLFDGKVT